MPTVTVLPNQIPLPSEIAHFVKLRTKPFPLTAGAVGVIPSASDTLTYFVVANGTDGYGNTVADGFDATPTSVAGQSVVNGGTVPGFVKGTLGGPTYNEVNDTAQDSPGTAEEVWPGRMKPPKIPVTFRNNWWTVSVLKNLVPGPVRVAPSMGRRLWEFVTASGIYYRYLGYLDWDTAADVGEGDKTMIECNIVTTGSPVIFCFTPPALG